MEKNFDLIKGFREKTKKLENLKKMVSKNYNWQKII